MTKGRPFSIYCIILFLRTEARKNNHILLQRGMYLSQKWSTAPFLPAGTQGSEALRVMRIVWHRRTCIRNLQSLHRRCPIWEPATHSHNGERNESAGSSHFAGNCKKRKKTAANGELATGNWKHSENSRIYSVFLKKNCPFSCQIPESGRESGHQVGETALKWLDNTVKPRPKIVWWNCRFSTKQQRKSLRHLFCHRLMVQ